MSSEINYVKLIIKDNQINERCYGSKEFSLLGSFVGAFGEGIDFVLEEIELRGYISILIYNLDIEGDDAIIKEDFSLVEEGEEPIRFITTKNKLMKMFTDWKILYEKGVESIIIYEKDTDFFVEAGDSFSGDVRSVFETTLMNQRNSNNFLIINEKKYVVVQRTAQSFYTPQYAIDKEDLIFQYASIEGNDESLVLLLNEFSNPMSIKSAFEWRNIHTFNPLYMQSITFHNNKIIIRDEVPYNKQLGQHPLESVVLDVDVFFNFLEQLLPLYEQYVKTITISYDGQSFKVSGHNA